MPPNTSAPRWAWISDQIRLAFGVTAEAAAAFLGSEETHARFAALLLKESAPSRLFVYFQPHDLRGAVCWLRAAGRGDCLWSR
jgi:hypothetical protein